MDRRRVLKGIGVIALYGTFPEVLGEFLASCKDKGQPRKAGFLSDKEFKLVEQVTDALLPATSTPGALDARVPYFIDLVVKLCLQKADQQLIRNGLRELEERQHFLSLSQQDKTKAISTIDSDAFKDDNSMAWFRIIKKLSLIGYFTSQEGMTKALNYVKIPADYKACIPYKHGEKALAKTFLMYW